MARPESVRRSSNLRPDVAFALDTLVRVVERQSREFRASILILSDDGKRVLDGAAPSLPEAYRRAIDGLEIGPAAGSCGTAAYRNAQVIVTDIQRDPLWADFRELVRPFGFAACWSQPIRGTSGEVLGTFAMYYTEPRTPTQNDLDVIEAAAARAASLLEQARAGADREQLIAGLV
jgi:GAF domain-containing protein